MRSLAIQSQCSEGRASGPQSGPLQALHGSPGRKLSRSALIVAVRRSLQRETLAWRKSSPPAGCQKETCAAVVTNLKRRTRETLLLCETPVIIVYRSNIAWG